MENQKQKNQLKEDIFYLFLKIGIFLSLLAVTFLYIFGICHCKDNMMAPAFQDGDLAVYYRLEKEYSPGEAVVIEKNGETQIRRIVAVAGDVVDMTAEGLKINGYLQQEAGIYLETLPYKEGISFPLTVGEEEYFVLGDHRTDAKDSRIYGTIHKQEIKGMVITLLRHRGL